MKHLFSIFLMMFMMVGMLHASPIVQADQNTYELTVEHPQDVLTVMNQEMNVYLYQNLAIVNDVGKVISDKNITTSFEKDHQVFHTRFMKYKHERYLKAALQLPTQGFKAVYLLPPDRKVKL